MVTKGNLIPTGTLCTGNGLSFFFFPLRKVTILAFGQISDQFTRGGINSLSAGTARAQGPLQPARGRPCPDLPWSGPPRRGHVRRLPVIPVGSAVPGHEGPLAWDFGSLFSSNESTHQILDSRSVVNGPSMQPISTVSPGPAPCAVSLPMLAVPTSVARFVPTNGGGQQQH